MYTNPIDTEKKEDKKPQGKVRRWLEELKRYDEEFKGWKGTAAKVKARYKDEKRTYESRQWGSPTRFNVLWSNVQTLQPALYARTPKVEIRRRFQDKDAIGRAAAQALERATDFCVDSYDFDGVMRSVRDDRLIPGRGTARVRYEPFFNEKKTRKDFQPKEGKLYSEGGEVYKGGPSEIQQDEQGFYQEEIDSELVYEEVKAEFVHHLDFYHSPARSWDEVRWVGFRYFMTRAELIERFGDELGKEIKLDWSAEGDRAKKDDAWSAEGDRAKKDDAAQPEHQYFDKATIWEIWDKDSRMVHWIAKSYTEKPLESIKDPLQLKDFFPCPKPLYATLTTDSLVPVPDYIMYQDQAEELDELSARIDALTKAIRLAGVYDASFEGVQRIMDEGAENQLIPVENWPAFQTKGGFNGVVQWMPLQEAANVLKLLYEARDRAKATLYEVTGMSDIIRGNSNPSETATAQQIKGQFATLRLSDLQAEVQRFARDLIALKAEIIAEHFDPETIRMMSGTDFLAEDDYGVQVTFEQAIELLRSDVMREFRIDIETDSTINIDEQQEKQAVTEYLQATGQFISQVAPVIQNLPALAPFMNKAIEFAARRYQAGRNMESALEQSLGAVTQQAMMMHQRQMQQLPGPEQIQQMQQQMQQMQQKGQQLEQENMQLKMQVGNKQVDMQMKQAELGMKQQELALKADEAGKKFQIERAKFVAQESAKTLEELGLETPREASAPKITDVEFFVDPETGRKRARAVTSKGGE
jgi:hypothetical protein